MTKRAKILFIIFVLFFLVVAYLIVNSERSQVIKSVSEKKTEKVSNEKLVADYKEKIKPIFAVCKNMALGNVSVKDLSDAKNNLLGLKVPREFMELHYNLAMFMDKIMATAGDQKKNIANQTIINQISTQYNWIN